MFLSKVVQVQRVDITPVVGFIFRSIFEELERIGDKVCFASCVFLIKKKTNTCGSDFAG